MNTGRYCKDGLFRQVNKMTREEAMQEPKAGHWIIYDVHGHKACKCSECDKDVGYPCNYKYCPYCGHRMLKPQESEEV